MRQTFRLVHETARENAIRVIQSLPVGLPGGGKGLPKPYVITVAPEEKKRSVDQNKYYWQLLNNAGLSCGEDAESLHHYCKCKFLGYTERVVFGDIYQVANSSARLGVKEFAAYCTQVEVFLAEQGLLQWS